MLLLYTIPAVLGAALKDALTPGGGDDDDDWGELAAKLAAEQMSYLMGLFAIVREFSEVGKIFTGQRARGYAGPSGLRVIPDAQTAAKQIAQGEFDDAFRKAIINLIGDISGMPAAQANRTITGIEALRSGETKNPAAIVFGHQKPR
ncbi:MAG: hypothetical protein WA210_05050 [Burkholderiaceae bacterium]